MTTNNTKYGVTNQLAQQAAIARRQAKPRVNERGERVGATGLSRREQMGALQDMRFVNLGQFTKPKKKSRSVMGQRMMFKGGGMVTAKPN